MDKDVRLGIKIRRARASSRQYAMSGWVSAQDNVHIPRDCCRALLSKAPSSLKRHVLHISEQPATENTEYVRGFAIAP